MGIYKYIQSLWKNPKKNNPELYRERLIQWRKEPVTVRLDYPTRLDRARSLGYKAIQGFVIVRQRVDKGGRMRPKIRKARRPKTRRHKKIVAKNYQRIAEERAQKKYKNLIVMNSYFVAEDGQQMWYEIIMVDPMHPEIQSREHFHGIIDKRDRANRGLTSAGRKSRGLRNKGKGAEKVRPSLRAHDRKAH